MRARSDGSADSSRAITSSISTWRPASPAAAWTGARARAMRTGSMPLARRSSSARTAWAASGGARPPPSSKRQPGAGGVEGARQRLEEQGRPLGLEVGAVRRSLGREARQDLAELGGGRLGAVGAQRRGEPAQRLRIGAVLGEHVAPGALGPRRVARLQVEPRDLDGELATVRSGGGGHPAGQVLDELGLAPGAGERGLVGAGRSAVGGVEIGEGAPHPRRLLGVPEVVLLDLGRPPEQRLPGPEVGSRRRGAGEECPGEPREVPGAGRDRLELAPGRRARRLGDERPGEDAHRLGRRRRWARGPPPRRAGGARPGRPDPARPRRPTGASPRAAASRRPTRAAAGAARAAGVKPGDSRSAASSMRRARACCPAAMAISAPRSRSGACSGRRGRASRWRSRTERASGLAPGVHVGLEEVEGGLVVGGVEVEGAGQRIAGAVRVAEPDEQQLGEPEVRRHGGGQVAGAAGEPGQLLAQGGQSPRSPCQRSRRSSARGWPGEASQARSKASRAIEAPSGS